MMAHAISGNAIIPCTQREKLSSLSHIRIE
jgi:hypothetical protein